MKKSIIAAVLTGVVLLAGCSDKSYNKLLSEKVNIEGQNAALEAQNKSLKAKNESLEAENSSLKSENSSLQAENKALHENNSGSESTPETLPQKPKTTEVYDDEFIKISYVGIGKGASYPYENRECIIFYIENKTEATYEFLCDSLSLDGVDVGKLACYSKIAPKSNGKIFFLKMSNTDQYFENKSPSKISGELSVKDYSDLGIFGDNWWHSVSFVNIEV